MRKEKCEERSEKREERREEKRRKKKRRRRSDSTRPRPRPRPRHLTPRAQQKRHLEFVCFFLERSGTRVSNESILLVCRSPPSKQCLPPPRPTSRGGCGVHRGQGDGAQPPVADRVTVRTRPQTRNKRREMDSTRHLASSA